VYHHKWYTTEAVDWDTVYATDLIHDAFKEALRLHFGGKFGGKKRLSGMIAFCHDPYHKNSHPIAIQVP
jgi:hypothetical protein